MKLLFICHAGMMRSPTAAWLFALKGHDTKFAGVSETFTAVPIKQETLDWADKVVFMHRDVWNDVPPGEFVWPRVTILNIPDEYSTGDPELVNMILGNEAAILHT